MRYLGIDYGEKRMGVAVSDEDSKIAFPLAELTNLGTEDRVVTAIKKIIKKEGIGKIILGIPVIFGKEESRVIRNIRDFGKKLQKIINTPLVYENEMFTTRLVKQSGVQKKHSNKAAAALILQAYLDKIRA